MGKITSVCPPDHKHAISGNCYNVHKCRCEPCVVAYRAMRRESMRKSRAKRQAEQQSKRPFQVRAMEARQMELGLRFLMEMEDEKFDLLVN